MIPYMLIIPPFGARVNRIYELFSKYFNLVIEARRGLRQFLPNLTNKQLFGIIYIGGYIIDNLLIK